MAQVIFADTITGTIGYVLSRIDEIDNGTKVTITDSLYTTTELISIQGAATITLQRAASPELADTAAKLALALDGIKYSGAITVTDALDASTDAVVIDATLQLTTGKVTATVTGTATELLVVLDNAKPTDALTLEVSDATAAQLKLLDAKTSVSVDASAVATITGTAADLKTVLAAKTIDTAENVAVEVTGTVTAADVNVIAKATTGVVTATVSGTAAALNAALTDTTENALTLELTGTTATAKDLKELATKTSETIDASDIATITGTLTDVTTVLGSVSIGTATDVAVTITGTLLPEDITALNAITTGGIVKATVKGTVNELADVTTAATDAITFVITNDYAEAADLKTLDAATSVVVNASAVKEISGLAADLKTIYASKTISGLGNEEVIFDDATVSADDVNAILKATTGKVVATVASSADAEALNKDLKDAKATDALTLTVTGAATAADLKALDAKTSEVVTALGVTEITGTAADVKTVLAATTIDTAANVAVTVTGTVSAADANTIADATAGNVTATIKDGAVAATLAAITKVGVADVITFKTTDKSADASDLKALKLLVNTFDVTSVKTITEVAASVADVAGALVIVPNAAVTITGAISAANANIIANATTGKVTATVTADTATNLVGALTNAAATDALTLTVSAGTATAADLLALDGKTSVVVDAKSVTTITGNAADVTDVLAAKTIAKAANVNVTVDSDAGTAGIQAISAYEANSIAKLTTGVVTASVDGSAAILNATLKDAKATDALTLTVTGTTATASDLKALDAKTLLAVDAHVADLVITGNAADVKTVLAADGITLDKTTIGDAVAVTVTGTVSAADANTITGATAGNVTATVAAGTADSLNTALANAVSADLLTLTVNGATATAISLNELNAKTSVDVKVDAKEVTGEFTDLNTLYSVAGFANLGNETVKITDTVSAANANTIANATTGKVTATVTAADAVTLVGALTNAVATDALTLTVNGATATAANLNTLDGKTSVDVTVDAVAVTGDFADLNKVYVTNKANFANLGNENVTIDDTTVTAAQANTIANATSGVVTATVADATAASLNAALKNAVATDVLTLTVNGATATAADLNALDGKTSVAVTVDAVAVTGTFADLNKVYVTNAANFAALEDENVTITDKTVAAADANTIANLIDGKVTATVTADTAANLNTALANAVATDALTLTVNGATATADNLNALDGKTLVDVKVDATEVTGDYADLYTMYVTNKANFTALGNENITIDNAATAEQINTIASLTTGKVTAAITDSAADLVAGLKNSVGTDAITLTVDSTATAKAADLITLDGKTSEDITVSADVVSGTYAELTKVYVTNENNFAALGNEDIIITDKTVTVAQLNAIKALTIRDVTATVVAGSAAALADLDSESTDAITLTVSGTTVAAGELNALITKTSEDITVSAATTITGDAAAVYALYVTNIAKFTGLGNEAVTITGAISDTNVDLIAAATTGKVTATVTADTATNLVDELDNALATDALTLTVNGATAEAADLDTLDGKTSVAVKVDAVAVTGTFTELNKVYVTNKANFANLGAENVTIDDVSVVAANANIIASATTGVVTATVAAASAATLNAALTDTTSNAYSLELTDTNLSSLTNLIALDGKTSAAVDAGSLLTISETFANLNTVYTSAGITELGNEAVTITDTQSAANVDSIADKIGTAVVTATVTADTAAALNAALVDSGLEVNAYALKITDTSLNSAALTNLTTLEGKTSVAVDASSVTTISGSSTEVAAAYATPTTEITGLGNETVTITGTDATVANVVAINNATSGLVTVGTINVDSVTFDLLSALKGSGTDLSGITGLTTIDAADGLVDTAMTITAADLFAANDGVGAIALTIDADATDTLTLTGWTAGATAGGYDSYSITYNTQTYTVNVTDSVVVAGTL